MDGLLRSVGDGITGLVSGAIGAIGAALSGIAGALGAALGPFAIPVAVAGVLVVAWLVLKR
jgi:hypothetical protein